MCDRWGFNLREPHNQVALYAPRTPALGHPLVQGNCTTAPVKRIWLAAVPNTAEEPRLPLWRDKSEGTTALNWCCSPFFLKLACSSISQYRERYHEFVRQYQRCRDMVADIGTVTIFPCVTSLRINGDPRV